MTKWISIAIVAVLVAVGAWTVWTGPSQDPIHATLDMRKFVETSYSENPGSGLPHDWLDCQERYLTEEEKAAERLGCRSWTAQGVTSTLVGLRMGDTRVPLVESRLESTEDGGPIVIEIVGGPGDPPFHVNEFLTEEHVASLQRKGAVGILNGVVSKTPEYQLLQRGFTIVSVGYWGTHIRTLNAPDEFQLGQADVRSVVDFYRDRLGEDPPLVTVSLGNHLTLAAMGKERIQQMNVLSIVPVMDGLQSHLQRALAKHAGKREKAKAEGELYGDFRSFNVYRQSETGIEFDYSQMLAMLDVVPQYIGDADHAWRDIVPQNPCSRIVLGTKDYRTADYLKAHDSLPEFVQVLEADHHLSVDQPQQTRDVYAAFADCIK